MVPSISVRFSTARSAASAARHDADAWHFLDYADPDAFTLSEPAVTLHVNFAGGRAHLARAGSRLLLVAGQAMRFGDRELTEPGALGAAFDRDAEDALRRLSGAFLVGYFDVARRTAVFATDRAGIRSPCFAVRGDEFVAGLTAGDVASAMATPPAIRAQALYDYLYSHVIPAPATVFEGVHRLLPGQYVLCASGDTRVATYWRPAYVPVDTRFDDAAARFRDLLRAAVSRQLDGAATGAFLSGGTDSSTITGILGEVTGSPPRAYSIGFDVPGFDEMAYARIAAGHFNAQHREYYLTPDDLLDSLPKVAASYDQPFGNSSVIPAYFCARLAHADGVTKLLGGDGGDEIFGGNTRYARQKVFEAYGSVPGWLRRHAVEPLLLGNALTARIPLVRKARSYVEQANVPMPGRMLTYNLVDRIGRARIFTPDFLSAVDPQRPRREQQSFYATCTDRDLVNGMLYFDWKHTLSDNDLPKVIGACDLADVGVGFPFLDDRLVAFANSLPSSWKVRGLKLRYFFKRALADFLPRDVITKQKHGFGMPFGPWMIAHDGLRAMTTGSLESLRDRGIIKREFMDELLGRVTFEHAGFYGELVWVMLMLEHWLAAHRPQFHFDAAAPG